MRNEITDLKNGVATKFTILLNGEEVEFILAVVESDFSFRDEIRWEFLYVNVDKRLYTSGTYSGGSTGCGCDYVNPLGEKKIRTTDLKEISRLGVASDQKRLDDQEIFKAKQQRAADKINELPVLFGVGQFGPYKLTIRRTPASYNPRYSSRIIGAGCAAEITTENSDCERNLWVENYFTKAGSFQKKKAVADYGEHAPAMLFAAKAKIQEIDNMVNRVKTENGGY